MNCRTVTDQAGYDAAISEGVTCVHIEGSATIEAYGSATIEASDSATVEAYGSATVRAYDSATVYALHRSIVTATRYVAVHKQSTNATVTGGHVIQMPQLHGGDPREWADYYGVDAAGDAITVYKAVDGSYEPNNTFPDGEYPVYTPGATVEAPDWDAAWIDCGKGLHFSPTPRHAETYHSEPEHYVACKVRLGDIVTLGDKVKARSCEVLFEVDRDGNKIEQPAEAAS